MEVNPELPELRWQPVEAREARQITCSLREMESLEGHRPTGRGVPATLKVRLFVSIKSLVQDLPHGVLGAGLHGQSWVVSCVSELTGSI